MVAILGTAPPYFYGAMISSILYSLYHGVMCLAGCTAGLIYKALGGNKLKCYAPFFCMLGANLSAYMVHRFTSQSANNYIVYMGMTVTSDTVFQNGMYLRFTVGSSLFASSYIGHILGHYLPPPFRYRILVNKNLTKVPKQPWYMNSILW